MIDNIDSVEINKSLIDSYKMMLLIRRFEEKAASLYTQRSINGFCHLYIGQEAIVTAMSKIKNTNDSVITAYRTHGHMLACGIDPKIVMAELSGKYSGCSKGKGGSMHMFSYKNNFYGGHGIVGAQVPLGTGLAFAHKYKQEDAISMVYMGDGACDQGQVFESFNMASLWSLPCLYIIEDNGYSMGTSVKRHSANPNYYKMGEHFNIPGKLVNGMDFLEVYKNAKWAIDYVRENSKPAILHIKTYRYRGHSMSDPGNYRTKEEVDSYRLKNDPILNLKEFLINKNIISEDNILQFNKEIKEIIKATEEFAVNSEFPRKSELYKDIYFGDSVS